MIEEVIKPMLEQTIIEPTDVSKLFLNIESLYEFHGVFLAEIRKKVTVWNSRMRISDVFLQLAPYMKLYSEFVNRYEEALADQIGLAITNEKFAVFVDHIGKMQFMNLFGAPFQRIPRYELLLKELLKYTPKDHTDYVDLQKAFSAVQAVAHHINEQKKHIDEIVLHHKIENKTFSQPTWCDVCGDFIWGFASQGLSCAVCTISAHSRCKTAIPPACVGHPITSQQGGFIRQISTSFFS